MSSFRKMIACARIPMVVFALALPMTAVLTGCRVEQTEEGEMPEVDVNVEEGSLPAYDVDAADVDVGTKEVEVTVPDIDIEMPEEGDPADDAGEEGPVQ